MYFLVLKSIKYIIYYIGILVNVSFRYSRSGEVPSDSTVFSLFSLLLPWFYPLLSVVLLR